MDKTFTISIYSENNVGLLNRISAIFLKRHINIESLTTSQSEINDVFRFIIIVQVPEDNVKKIIKQIEKQVDVIRAFYHTDEETIFQESALYKVKSSALFEERHIQNIIKERLCQTPFPHIWVYGDCEYLNRCTYMQWCKHLQRCIGT